MGELDCALGARYCGDLVDCSGVEIGRSVTLCWWFPREDAAADYECGHDRRENHQWHQLHCHCGVLRRLTLPLRAIIRRSAYQVLAMFAAILRALSRAIGLS